MDEDLKFKAVVRDFTEYKAEAKKEIEGLRAELERTSTELEAQGDGVERGCDLGVSAA